MFEVSSFGLYFQSSQRIQCPQFIILLRLLKCALYFDKVLETPVTSLMERKGAVIPFCRFSTGALEMVGTEVKGRLSFPKGRPPSASPTKLSAASIYSRMYFQTPSSEAKGSFSCDILHSLSNTNEVLCLCECFVHRAVSSLSQG